VHVEEEAQTPAPLDAVPAHGPHHPHRPPFGTGVRDASPQRARFELQALDPGRRDAQCHGGSAERGSRPSPLASREGEAQQQGGEEDQGERLARTCLAVDEEAARPEEGAEAEERATHGA
jgi:hypothetical protein